MNKHHRELLEEVKRQSKSARPKKVSANYSGSGHTKYGLSNPQERQITKAWIKNHPGITTSQLEELLNSLYSAPSQDEKTLAGKLLEYFPRLRAQLKPSLIDTWLNHLEGWEEVDSLCQSNFTAKELLDNWPKWEKLLKNLNKSPNINKRRASLVFLTGLVSKSDDPRLTSLAFENIDNLKDERDILITKAVSWLLRDLTKLHRKEVEDYLEKNINTLPSIAIRETKNKLKTGRK